MCLRGQRFEAGAHLTETGQRFEISVSSFAFDHAAARTPEVFLNRKLRKTS